MHWLQIPLLLCEYGKTSILSSRKLQRLMLPFHESPQQASATLLTPKSLRIKRKQTSMTMSMTAKRSVIKILWPRELCEMLRVVSSALGSHVVNLVSILQMSWPRIPLLDGERGSQSLDSTALSNRRRGVLEGEVWQLVRRPKSNHSRLPSAAASLVVDAVVGVDEVVEADYLESVSKRCAPKVWSARQLHNLIWTMETFLARMAVEAPSRLHRSMRIVSQSVPLHPALPLRNVLLMLMMAMVTVKATERKAATAPMESL